MYFKFSSKIKYDCVLLSTHVQNYEYISEPYIVRGLDKFHNYGLSVQYMNKNNFLEYWEKETTLNFVWLTIT